MNKRSPKPNKSPAGGTPTPLRVTFSRSEAGEDVVGPLEVTRSEVDGVVTLTLLHPYPDFTPTVGMTVIGRGLVASVSKVSGRSVEVI